MAETASAPCAARRIARDRRPCGGHALADETADRINDMMLLIGATLDRADADKIADATGYDFHEGRP